MLAAWRCAAEGGRPIDMGDLLSLRPRIVILLVLAASLPTPSLARALGVVAPVVVSGPVVSAGSDSALLSVTMVPAGGELSWTVQYGLTAGYGATTPAQTLPGGVAPVAVSASLGGLVADATYHYRLAIVSGLATTYTPDATFRTGSAVVVVTDPGQVGDPGEGEGGGGSTEAEGHADAPVPPAAVGSRATPAPVVAVTPAPPAAPGLAAAPVQADTKVSARVTATSAARGTVRVTVRAGEALTIRATVRGAKTKTYTLPRPGTRTLAIRARTTARVTITLVITDRSGNTLTIIRHMRSRRA